jgi:hypothetical protein
MIRPPRGGAFPAHRGHSGPPVAILVTSPFLGALSKAFHAGSEWVGQAWPTAVRSVLLLRAVADGSKHGRAPTEGRHTRDLLCQPCSGEPHTQLGQIA